MHPNTRAHLKKDGGKRQMMGQVGPTIASATPEILTVQQFLNQPFIYTPTSAYATYRYGTSPHQEYLLEFTSEYGISEALHPELPGPEDRIVDFPEGKQEAWEKYLAVLHQAFRLFKKLEQPLLLGGQEGVLNYRGLAHECSKKWDAGRESVFPRGCENTGHTPYPNPETTRGATLLSGVKPQILPRRRDMDLFNLIRAPNPTKVKTGSRPCVAHEVPLLTVTANRVIEMEDPTAATDHRGRPGNCDPGGAAHQGRADYERDQAAPRPTESTREGKSLAAIEVRMGSTRLTPAPQGAPVDVRDPDPLSFADPQSRPSVDVAQSSKGAATVGDPKSENTSFASMVGSPESIYRPEWGITNGSMLDTPEACQDLVDHVAPPGYFSERHLHNDDFLKQYNVNLARKVPMGSQLRLRFKQEAKLLKKSVAQVACRDKRIQARENEIKNLESLLETEADMKKAAEDKSAELSQELENMRALFSDLQEFKQYEDNRVEQRCAEMDARLDALSIDFDEELYPYMLTAITGHRWMIGRGLRLAVMKCGESIELRQAFEDVVSAGIAKGMSEGLKHGALKNLVYPLVDQLEGLKDVPMDVIMASMHLKSDTGDDAPQWVRELHPSSSQLTIPVYPEVCDPMDPWACKEEILLVDAIAANVSRAEKEKMPRGMPYTWVRLRTSRPVRWCFGIRTNRCSSWSCYFVGGCGYTDRDI
nr:hypothetical protein [Tanacetum cinerariifolium]